MTTNPPSAAKPPMRVFLAHPKDAPATELQGQCWAIAQRFAKRAPGRSITVRSGLQEWQSSFAHCGRNWSRWAERVGRGAGLDGQPYYNFYVCTFPGAPLDITLARATGEILSHALSMGKDVVWWDVAAGTEGFAFHRALGCGPVDANDFKAGYRLRLETKP